MPGNKFMNTKLLCWVFIFILSCLGTGFAQNKIIAIVNNEVITQKDLDDFVNFMRIQLGREFKGGELDAKIQSMEVELMERLIEDRLILQEANKSKVSVDQNRIREKVEEIRRRYSSDVDYQASLAKQGLVEADIEQRIKEQMLMYSIIQTKVRDKIVVAPQEVTDFYNQNLEEFKIPEQREFESLSTDSEEIAKKAYEQLEKGKALYELEKDYSGEISKITAYSGELRKDIEDTVFHLRVGEISRPQKIDNKFYIFSLNKIISGRQQSLAEAQDGIFRYIFDRKVQEELTRWLNGIKETSYIKIM